VEGLVQATAAKKAKASKSAKTGPASKAVTPPDDAALSAELGKAWSVWTKLVTAVEVEFAPLERLWFPSKTLALGRYCRLMRKDRTFLYLLPEKGKLIVAVVLGERAYGLAMKSTLPAAVKKMLQECKVYPEGRFVRFPVTAADIPAVVQLVELKTMPKLRSERG
jgi:hypothetical protein